MAKRQLPSQEVLRQLLDYDPSTGALRWKERGVEWFSDGKHSAERVRDRWNATYSGQGAFICDDGKGYRVGTMFGRQWLAHRVIWKMETGQDPVEVDHINHCRSDNRFHNLRAVDSIGNKRNLGPSPRNTSGVMGVSWHKRANKWRVGVSVRNVNIHVGLFSCIAQAIKARDVFYEKHGFHPHHGKSAV